LQVANKAFDLIGHLIERCAELAQFSSTQHLHAPREVTSGNPPGAGRQLAHRTRQLFGKKEPNKERQDCRDKAHKQHLVAHLAHRR
jgi:hypothetical protein